MTGHQKVKTPNSGKKKIAYLSLDIPALSATFVYNEILALENRGFEIVPISVLVPDFIPEEDDVADLAYRTIYLYRDPTRLILLANIYMLLQHPLRYLKTLFTMLYDFIKTGPFSRKGIGLLYRFMYSSRVSHILKKRECSHVHAHFAHVPTDLAMYASMISGIPFSFTSHANDLFERGWLLKEKTYRAKFAATISEYNRRFLIERGAQREKVHIVRCGVDSKSFTYCGEKALGKVPRIGSLGRMVEKKGFDILIHACGMLKQMGNSFHLNIAGDGPMREEIHELISSLGLSNLVSLGGPLAHHKVANWLSELDLFVLPCKRDKKGDMDGIPVALMEAMLSGVPVISTKLSGISELIEDGVTGSLVASEDPEGLSIEINRVLKDSALRNRLRMNAIRKVQTEFDLFRNVAKLSNLFMGVN